jgi:tetratricopeptide (TPR) repeat protein
MLPASNESQYTHNTPLQLLSELGYPVLIAGVFLVLFAMRAWNRGEYRSLSPYIVPALIVWVAHNMIDINVYFPSLGVIGVVLLGTLLRKPSGTLQPGMKAGSMILAAFGMLTLAFAGLVMVSSELQVRAKGEYEENRLSAAAETLEIAKSVMPLNSSLFHDSGDVNLNLHHVKHDARYLEVARKSFERAIALSPNKSGAHMGLGLCLSSADEIDDALAALRIAQRLHPDSTYVRAIVRLVEKRKAEQF